MIVNQAFYKLQFSLNVVSVVLIYTLGPLTFGFGIHFFFDKLKLVTVWVIFLDLRLF